MHGHGTSQHRTLSAALMFLRSVTARLTGRPALQFTYVAPTAGWMSWLLTHSDSLVAASWCLESARWPRGALLATKCCDKCELAAELLGGILPHKYCGTVAVQ